MQITRTPFHRILPITALLACEPGAIDAGASLSGDSNDTDSDSDSETSEGIGGGDDNVLPGDGDGETGDSETGDAWEEIRCIQGSAGAIICYGRPMNSEDSWVPVVMQCSLDVLPGESQSWDETTCAPGLAPGSGIWDSIRCFSHVSTQGSMCFGASGDWAAVLIPACAVAQGPIEAWPAAICIDSSLGQIGLNPWDDTWCLGESGTCFAEADGSLIQTVPTCWLDEQPAAQLPICP